MVGQMSWRACPFDRRYRVAVRNEVKWPKRKPEGVTV